MDFLEEETENVHAFSRASIVSLSRKRRQCNNSRTYKHEYRCNYCSTDWSRRSSNIPTIDRYSHEMSRRNETGSLWKKKKRKEKKRKCRRESHGWTNENAHIAYFLAVLHVRYENKWRGKDLHEARNIQKQLCLAALRNREGFSQEETPSEHIKNFSFYSANLSVQCSPLPSQGGERVPNSNLSAKECN